MMTKYWPIAVIVVVFGGLGLMNALKPAVGESVDAKLVQSRLASLPETLGDWTSQTESIPEKQLAVAEAQAHLRRMYKHPKTGQRLNIMILYGEPGPLGAHTPETCYEGAGFKQAGAAKVQTITGKAGDYWCGNFEAADMRNTLVNVNWTWGVNGVWKASDNPRYDFAAHKTIYKLYVTRTVPERPAPSDKNPLDEFLPAFLEQLQNHLTSSGQTPSLPSENGKTQ
jgi:Protein of unknown function (DUF3485)